jgi:hypothetical protein
MRFAKGQLPPVEGFWSGTMYDGAYFFGPNSINRYSISARQNLKANPDGSVDLTSRRTRSGPIRRRTGCPPRPLRFFSFTRPFRTPSLQWQQGSCRAAMTNEDHGVTPGLLRLVTLFDQMCRRSQSTNQGLPPQISG